MRKSFIRSCAILMAVLTTAVLKAQQSDPIATGVGGVATVVAETQIGRAHV